VSDFFSDREKAGYWIDGAIHGGELGSAETAMAVAETLRRQIAASRPRDYLAQVVFYLVPVINPDGRHYSLGPPYKNQRRNLRPVDDDGDGRFDEDEPGGADPPGGVDLNRNFPVGSYQVGGQEMPAHVPATLEPETDAVIRFWKRHPEIQLAVSYHSSAILFVRPFGVADADAAQFDAAFGVYSRVIDGAEWKIPESRAFNRLTIQRLRGLTMEWFYRERNALAFTIEMTPVRRDLSLLKGRVEVHARFLLQLAEMLPLTGRGS